MHTKLLTTLVILSGALLMLPSAMADKVILTSGTSWSVPANWSDTNNTIEAIGGGGGGRNGGTATPSGAGGGGAGGAYAKVVNQALSGSITYSIGSAGSANGGTGGDTTFHTILTAKGGGGASAVSGSTGGAGGTTQSGSVGSTINLGGAGGAGGNSDAASGGGGGGGGAGGLNGIGTTGVTGSNNGNEDDEYGNGGGGGSGDAGSGGSGGGGGTTDGGNGVAGSVGTEWTSVGSGGGGGGGAGAEKESGGGGNGATGGNYGAGGGGGGGDDSDGGGAGSGAVAKQGVIVITWTPGVAPASPENITSLWVTPTVDSNHTQNELITYSVNYTCNNGPCNINYTLDPPLTNPPIDWSINLGSDSGPSPAGPIGVVPSVSCYFNNSVAAFVWEKDASAENLTFTTTSDNTTVTHKTLLANSAIIRQPVMDCKGSSATVFTILSTVNTMVNWTSDYGVTWGGQLLGVIPHSESTSEVRMLGNDHTYLFFMDQANNILVYRSTTVSPSFSLRSNTTIVRGQIGGSQNDDVRVLVSGTGGDTDTIYVISGVSGDNFTEYISTDSGATFDGGTSIYTGQNLFDGDSTWAGISPDGTKRYLTGTNVISNGVNAYCGYYYDGSSWQSPVCVNDTAPTDTCYKGVLDGGVIVDDNFMYFVADCYNATSPQTGQLHILKFNGSWQPKINLSEPGTDNWYMPKPSRNFLDGNFLVTATNTVSGGAGNVTLMSYAAGATVGKSGAILPCPATPFCTDDPNQVNLTVADGVTVQINWSVNATGTPGTSHSFFATGEEVTNTSITTTTNTLTITIPPLAGPVDDCTCTPGSAWTIDDGSACVLTTDCDLGANGFRGESGSLTIQGGGRLSCTSYIQSYDNFQYVSENTAQRLVVTT